MKIRRGFVTNSSSTSFLILSKKEITAEYLLTELGFRRSSPIYEEGCALVSDMMHHLRIIGENEVDEIVEYFGEEMLGIFRQKRNKGWFAYIGDTASDEQVLSSFFTMDSTIVRNSHMVIDARRCLW